MHDRRDLVLVGLLLSLIVWGSCSEYRSARARQAAQERADSIQALLPLLGEAEGRAEAAAARAEAVEGRYALDSLRFEQRIDSLEALVDFDEEAFDALGDSIAARVDAQTRAMLRRQEMAHERIVARKDSVIATEREEKEQIRVRVAEWMATAQRNREGWDLERELRIQEQQRADIWQAEAERLSGTSTLRRVLNGLPWLAAGYLGAKLTPG